MCVCVCVAREKFVCLDLTPEEKETTGNVDVTGMIILIRIL